MELDPETCWRAHRSRDPRFDGRFFTAVTSTGVYCRPVCPAPTPRRANVRFYACAAAAEAAGFRPCLRCRPETAPGTPAWQGTPATVARALRLIEQGALDAEGAGLESLAARLGVGGRHLRRLFERHLGASPLAVAQTRRVRFAKQLVDQTELPLTQIAFAAGFGSVRRFNAAMRATYGRPPGQLRRTRWGAGDGRGTREERAARPRPAAPAPAPADGLAGLELRLPLREPYDWDGLLAFLGPRAVPGLERVDGGTYRRAAALPGPDGRLLAGVIAVRRAPRGGALLLAVPPALAGALLPLAARARALFDLDADPAAIAERLAADPRLAPLVCARPGLRVPGAWEPWELAARAVLGQQVSVKGATTLAGRLAAALGAPLPGADGWRLFPSPAAVARADLSRLGVPRARAAALRTLAAAVRDGAVDLAAPGGADAARAALRALPGIGAWTAEYVALRALGDPDAWPDGDLGLRRAVARLAGGPAPTPRALRALAEAWRPWRAYAALHLWTADSTPGTARSAPSRRSRAAGAREARGAPRRNRARRKEERR